MLLSNSCWSNKVYLSLRYLGGSLSVWANKDTGVSANRKNTHNTLSFLLKQNSNYLVSSIAIFLVQMRYTYNLLQDDTDTPVLLQKPSIYLLYIAFMRTEFSAFRLSEDVP